MTCPMNTDYSVENLYLINNNGKYEINSQDINVNISYQITYDNIQYNLNDDITFNVRNNNGQPVPNFKLFIENPNDNYVLMLEQMKTVMQTTN